MKTLWLAPSLCTQFRVHPGEEEVKGHRSWLTGKLSCRLASRCCRLCPHTLFFCRVFSWELFRNVMDIPVVRWGKEEVHDRTLALTGCAGVCLWPTKYLQAGLKYRQWRDGKSFPGFSHHLSHSALEERAYRKYIFSPSSSIKQLVEIPPGL